MPELEAVAANAISTFVVLASEQLKSDPENAQHLSWLLAG
jgi:hypothetical protein